MCTTFTNMTDIERAEYIGCWVNTPRGHGVLLDQSVNSHYKPIVVIPSSGKIYNSQWGWSDMELLPETPRAWQSDGTVPTHVPTIARARKRPSLVYGETQPYSWTVYQGNTPVKRFIWPAQAWRYFLDTIENMTGIPINEHPTKEEE